MRVVTFVALAVSSAAACAPAERPPKGFYGAAVSVDATSCASELAEPLAAATALSWRNEGEWVTLVTIGPPLFRDRAVEAVNPLIQLPVVEGDRTVTQTLACDGGSVDVEDATELRAADAHTIEFAHTRTYPSTSDCADAADVAGESCAISRTVTLHVQADCDACGRTCIEGFGSCAVLLGADGSGGCTCGGVVLEGL